jgi:hypothetical protein
MVLAMRPVNLYLRLHMCDYPAYANDVRDIDPIKVSCATAIFRPVPQRCEAQGGETHQFSDHFRCALDFLRWTCFVGNYSTFPLLGELATRLSLVHISSFYPRRSTREE